MQGSNEKIEGDKPMLGKRSFKEAMPALSLGASAVAASEIVDELTGFSIDEAEAKAMPATRAQLVAVLAARPVEGEARAGAGVEAGANPAARPQLVAVLATRPVEGIAPAAKRVRTDSPGNDLLSQLSSFPSHRSSMSSRGSFPGPSMPALLGFGSAGESISRPFAAAIMPRRPVASYPKEEFIGRQDGLTEAEIGRSSSRPEFG